MIFLNWKLDTYLLPMLVSPESKFIGKCAYNLIFKFVFPSSGVIFFLKRITLVREFFFAQSRTHKLEFL